MRQTAIFHGGNVMKKFLKSMYLPYCTLILGILSFLCMYWLYATGLDERMLLDPLHPGAILTWLLTAVMIAAVILLSRPLTGKMRYERVFPGSLAGAIGTGISAVGIAITAYGELTAGSDRIVALGGWLGLLSAVSLLYLSFCRYAQIRPLFFARSAVLLYLMLHLLCRYRVWSAEPELLRYGFELAATVCFLLACYNRLAIEAGMFQRRSYLCFSMLGTYFAMAALPGASDRVFLITMAVWAMTDLCSLRSRRPRMQEDV